MIWAWYGALLGLFTGIYAHDDLVDTWQHAMAWIAERRRGFDPDLLPDPEEDEDGA